MVAVEGKKIDFHEPINSLFHVGRAYKGEVGIEVEVEGVRLPRAIPSYWGYHPDGSLRGRESAEYVLKQPCLRRSVPKFLKYLKACLDKNKAVVEESNRTSVHIHLNMSKKSLTDCYTLMMLYFVFEPLMSKIAGDSRTHNLFCLQAADAEYFVDILAKSAKQRKFNPNPEQLRYTSVNACAITKFNSIEFRALRGTVDPVIISEWVDLLLKIKDAAADYKDPSEVIGQFSRVGPEQFIQDVFGKKAYLLLNQPDYADQMWEATRLVQEIAFATDWSDRQKPKRMFEIAPKLRPGEDD